MVFLKGVGKMKIYSDEKELIDVINSLENYEGYVQFSHRGIEKERDIFIAKEINVAKDEHGFIYEAHFFNALKRVSQEIKYINGLWYLSEVEQVPSSDEVSYKARFGNSVKMAQIWEEQEDALCEDMRVKKLKKVVFSGFEPSKEKQSNLTKELS